MTTKPRVLQAGTDAAAELIADHFDDFFRTVFAPDDAFKTRACMRYITGEAHPLGNLAMFSRRATPADVTHDASALCDGSFPSAILILGEGAPAQIAAASELGFSPAEQMPLMSVTPDTLTSTALPSDYVFREVDFAETAAWVQTFSDGYGLPLRIGSLFSFDRSSSRAPGETKYYAVEHEGDLVATSLIYLHEGFAGIYGVATLPEHRGKGLGAHLTAEPLRRAWDFGYTTGILQASEMGAPVYARIGFQTHGVMTLLVRIPE